MTVKIHDVFSDAPFTWIESHAVAPVNVPGSTWDDVFFDVSAAHNVLISSFGNSAYIFGGSFTTLAVIDCGSSDGNMSFVLNGGSTANWISGACLRFVDYQNYFFLWARNDTQTLELNLRSGGGNTPLASKSCTLGLSTDYTVSVSMSGDLLSATVNGVTVSAINSTFNTSTKHGFLSFTGNGGGDGTGSLFKNFIFDDGIGPPPGSGGGMLRQLMQQLAHSKRRGGN